MVKVSGSVDEVMQQLVDTIWPTDNMDEDTSKETARMFKTVTATVAWIKFEDKAPRTKTANSR